MLDRRFSGGLASIFRAVERDSELTREWSCCNVEASGAKFDWEGIS
jgi:hypothetical protein